MWIFVNKIIIILNQLHRSRLTLNSPPFRSSDRNDSTNEQMNVLARFAAPLHLFSVFLSSQHQNCNFHQKPSKLGNFGELHKSPPRKIEKIEYQNCNFKNTVISIVCHKIELRWATLANIYAILLAIFSDVCAFDVPFNFIIVNLNAMHVMQCQFFRQKHVFSGPLST